MDKNGNIVFTNDIDEANVNKTIARGKSEGFEMFEQSYVNYLHLNRSGGLYLTVQ